MVLVNGGFLHCTDIKEFFVNSSLKATKKKRLEQSQKTGEQSRAILAVLFGFVENIVGKGENAGYLLNVK